MNFPEHPCEAPLLLAALDVTGYAAATQLTPPAQTFRLLGELYELIGTAVERQGGTVLKFMGDIALVVFSPSAAQDAVSALTSLQAEANRWLTRLGANCRLRVRAHLGTVAFGRLGAGQDRRPDVIGAAVNDLFLMPAAEFTLSPELQRHLGDASGRS